jgi:hypothetical protein
MRLCSLLTATRSVCNLVRSIRHIRAAHQSRSPVRISPPCAHFLDFFRESLNLERFPASAFLKDPDKVDLLMGNTAYETFITNEFSGSVAFWLSQILTCQDRLPDLDIIKYMCFLLAKRPAFVTDDLLVALFTSPNFCLFTGNFTKVLISLDDFENRDLDPILQHFSRYKINVFFPIFFIVFLERRHVLLLFGTIT